MVSFDTPECTANAVAHQTVTDDEEDDDDNEHIDISNKCSCDSDSDKKEETMTLNSINATTTTTTTTTATTNNDNTNSCCSYRMVALDLDGTILQSNRQISDATVNYLQDLSKRGIIIAICTGRSFQSACPYIVRLKHLSFSLSSCSTVAKQQQQQQRLIPIVCTNGAKGMLVDAHQDDNHDCLPSSKNGDGSDNNDNNRHNGSNPHRDTTTTIAKTTTLFHNTFSIEAMESIEDIAEGLNTKVVVVWYYDQYTHVYSTNKGDIQLVQFFEKVTKSKISILPPSQRCGSSSKRRRNQQQQEEEDNDNSVSSCCLLPSRVVILFHDINVDTQSIATAFESQLNPHEAYIVPGYTKLYMEILPGIQVNKGNALQELCDALQVNIKQCIAIGDGDNDMEFLDMAGFGICMRNGTQRTKSIADYVTNQTNDEDGVIQALGYLLETKTIQFGYAC